MEGDVIGFESIDNLYQEPEYRVVESTSQLKSVYNLILQNLAQIEAECDLKNALEMCHVAISFRVLEKEINFVFLPVFPKNFRISENYSSWVQLKSILKSGDAGSPSRGTAISTFFKHKLLGSRINFLLFVESSPEKFAQSHTILEESSKLLNELRSSPQSKRRHDDSGQNSRLQNSEGSSQYNGSEDLDLYSKQVIQEITQFISRAEQTIESLEQSPSMVRPQGEELRRQIDVLEQKVEIANESSKASIIKQKLMKGQNKLNQLRETIDFMISSRKEPTRASTLAQIDTLDRPSNGHGTRKNIFQNQRYESLGGLPPKSLSHTKKKSSDYEDLKKFNGGDYKGKKLLR